jgi:hypothetical protein
MSDADELVKHAAYQNRATWDVVYETTGWDGARRAAFTNALNELGIEHSWSGIEITVPRGHETAVDRLIESLTEPKVSLPDAGRPGRSAQVAYERRHMRREERIDARWGKHIAPIVKRLSDDPQSTRAWANGAWGEEWAGGNLERLLGGRAVILHDRRVPRTRGNIDHLAIASSGVWVIDTKNYQGRVELRDVGGWFRVDRRLYVAGRDRTKLVGGLDWQVKAVETCLAEMEVRVRPVLCFVKGWGRRQKPFEIDGTLVIWSAKLAEWIAEAGPLDTATVKRVAILLADVFPAK